MRLNVKDLGAATQSEIAQAGDRAGRVLSFELVEKKKKVGG
jgi:hypothetical protein